MSNIIYKCETAYHQPDSITPPKTPISVTLPLASVMVGVGSEYDENKYLTSEIAKLFIDSIRDAGRLDEFGDQIIEIVVRVDAGYGSPKYIGEPIPQPWPILVEINYKTRNPMNWSCIAIFHPPAMY